MHVRTSGTAQITDCCMNIQRIGSAFACNRPLCASDRALDAVQRSKNRPPRVKDSRHFAHCRKINRVGVSLAFDPRCVSLSLYPPLLSFSLFLFFSFGCIANAKITRRKECNIIDINDDVDRINRNRLRKSCSSLVRAEITNHACRWEGDACEEERSRETPWHKKKCPVSAREHATEKTFRRLLGRCYSAVGISGNCETSSSPHVYLAPS